MDDATINAGRAYLNKLPGDRRGRAALREMLNNEEFHAMVINWLRNIAQRHPGRRRNTRRDHEMTAKIYALVHRDGLTRTAAIDQVARERNLGQDAVRVIWRRAQGWIAG